jgi:hypothetical protein
MELGYGEWITKRGGRVTSATKPSPTTDAMSLIALYFSIGIYLGFSV